MVLASLFAALTAVCAWLSIPLPPVAFTLQTFGLLLTLGVLGANGAVSAFGCICCWVWWVFRYSPASASARLRCWMPRAVSSGVLRRVRWFIGFWKDLADCLP